MIMTKSLLVNATRQYDSKTQNGAVTHSTSLSKCLDLFFIAGASRNISDEDIEIAFAHARAENRHLAWRIALWARDCRGGAGEKRFFQVIGKYANKHYPEEWSWMSLNIPDIGSWKDFFVIEEPNADLLNFLQTQLEESPTANLLAKWFPRKGPWFVAMHKYCGWSPKQLRKYLVSKTNVVEHKICANQLGLINYSTVPSVAMNKYSRLFNLKDPIRYVKYLEDVKEGRAKINASVLFPSDIVKQFYAGGNIYNPDNADAMQAQWDALPDYMLDSAERILPICDVSGSMTNYNGLPMIVSLALGLYISERNKSIFKDAVVTFSQTPEMHYIQGDSLHDRLQNLISANWGFNTDLEATFDLILDSACRIAIPEDQMPTKLLIISDMEFDIASRGGTNFDAIKQKYADVGYKMPEIIFWNVAGRMGNVPVNANESNVGLVSGFSPSILTTVLNGEIISPYQLMRDAVDTDKYIHMTKSLNDCL
jgi:hypothetical protein